MPLTPDQEEVLSGILERASNTKLNEWETKFIGDMTGTYEKVGADMFLSPKQWAALERIDEKVQRS